MNRATDRVLSIRWIVTFVAVGLTTAAVLSVGTVAERNARQALTPAGIAKAADATDHRGLQRRGVIPALRRHVIAGALE